MIQVLLVDNDRHLRRRLTGYLDRFSMCVTALDDGRALKETLSSRDGGAAAAADVLLLDLMQPYTNGLELCRWVRGVCGRLPLIMLDARGDAMNRIVGLEVGADDVLPKPFEPRELVARIHALLRRMRIVRKNGGAAADGTGQRSSFAGWTLDRASRRLVSPENASSMLSNAEYRLLCAFLDHPRSVLSRDRLLDMSHAGARDVADRAIDLAVSRLRQRLGSAAALIRTIRGEGYVFELEAA